ncbi:MAG: hypothetical protein NVS1B10_00250 [Candidatus Saccharimonadales bacterium]
MTGNNFTKDFSLADFHAFATKPDVIYGVWLNLISLQGFWYTAWHSLKDYGGFWPILVGLWLIPVFVGIGSAIEKPKRPAAKLLIALGGVSTIAILLAAGPNDVVGSINSWLYLHVPGLSGMREPHKFLALLALFYATATAYGIDSFGHLNRPELKRGLTILSLIMISMMSFYIFWGANNQLRLVNYPASWQQFYVYLNQQPNKSRVLALPYELYLNKTFAHRLIADPAGNYFGEKVISSPDPKLPGLKTYESGKYAGLDYAIASQDPQLLRKELHNLNIGYLMFIASDDTANYNWAKQIPHTTLLDSRQLLVLKLTD